jgi:tyrosine-protein kinase Etk/Wzc
LEKEVNILDLILVSLKHKWLIIKIIISITFVALVIALIWPKTYKSTTRFLPPASQGIGGGGLMGSLIGNLASMPMPMPTLSPENIVVVLNSNTLREQLIEEFDLYEVYGTDIKENVLKSLDNNTIIKDVREGGFGFNPIVSIELSVTDREPQRARDIAKFYIEKADSIIRVLNAKNAQERFAIFETRYQKNLEEMSIAEEVFRDFQQKYGVLDIESQAKAMVENLAELKSEIVRNEVSLNVVAQTMGSDNFQYNQLQRTVTELNNQYENMIRRTDRHVENIDVFIPILDMPDLYIEYMRLYRDVVIQGKVFETLYPQYEFQRMYQNADFRAIQIVDEPDIPTYKDKPKRAFIVLGGFFFALLLSILIVAYKELNLYAEEKNSEDGIKLKKILNHFRPGNRSQ